MTLARVEKKTSETEWQIIPAAPGTEALTVHPQVTHGKPEPGDWVLWSDDTKTLSLLTLNQHTRKIQSNQNENSFFKSIRDPRRVHAVRIRKKVTHAIRAFLESKCYLEVETPLLVPSPGMEAHIRPLSVHQPAEANRLYAYLPTSPEFAMKRLLAGGLERIFQISPAFRDEPKSPHHLQQFTMLEFYRALATDTDLMNDVEELIYSVSMVTHGHPHFIFEGQTVDVSAPFLRFTPRELFKSFLNIDLKTATIHELSQVALRIGHSIPKNATWDDLYFLLWLNEIEPHLPKDRAFFIHQYPASQAALSIVDQSPDGYPFARRFEVYAGGLELGNAFQELTDPTEQRRRFIEDMKLRQNIYGSSFPASPIDEGFMSALCEGVPPSSGIAMGVDRLVMLAAGEPDIHFTHWLT